MNVVVKGALADGKTPDGQKYSDVCELDEVKLLLVGALAGGAARPLRPSSPPPAQTAPNAKAASPPVSPRLQSQAQSKVAAAGGKSPDLQKDSKQTLPVAKAPAPGKTSPSNAVAGTHAPTASPPPRRGK